MVGIVGLIGYGLAATFTAASGWMYRDKIDSKYEEEKAEILEKGVKKYLTETKDSLTGNFEKVGDSLDEARASIDKTLENVEKVRTVATSDNPIAEIQKEFNNGNNPQEETGIFPAIGKFVQGDFVGAAKSMEAGDYAIAGGSAFVGTALMKWIGGKVFGGKDEESKSSIMPDFSTILLMGLAATVFMNKDFIAQKIGWGDEDDLTAKNTYNNAPDPFTFEA